MVATPPDLSPPAPTEDTASSGLTDAEVRDRVERGLVNDTGERTSRTFGEIVRANIFTRFNAILGTMLVVILAAGRPKDALFGIVLVSNALIGIVQEMRAKKTLDRLAVLSAPRATAIRDGHQRELPVEEVVLDDLLALRTGDQVPADGFVRAAEGLEVDESLLTGESEPVEKGPGDDVLSGSFVVAGTGSFQATRIGADAYARKLAAEARRFTLVHSELISGINTILKYVTYAIIPCAILLLIAQFAATDLGWQEAIAGMVAGVVAMVPEGLVLLTSIAFGVAAVTLARRNVLVQELPAVEGLARVDVVCLDKTGTLTEGSVVFDRLEPLALFARPTDGEAGELGDALGALAASADANATLSAIGSAFPAPSGWDRTGTVPFSSARKWSAAAFGSRGSWVIGAPEMVRPDAPANDAVRSQADELAACGFRVLLLARADGELDGDTLPANLQPAALVLLEEKVRPDASDTLRYFSDQGVALKVISGDNPRTVGAVAQRVGLPDAGDPVDARTLPDDSEGIADVIGSHSAFGRVSPHQKRAMVEALHTQGHVVAMTGDGVNDALALKDADIGVAMGSGAAATRAVAQLVLLDGRFATMPGVVAEGRRVIANIERVANLFVTKTVYAVLLALVTSLLVWPYPFLPRHLTLVSTLMIGIPAFFLSLAPNTRRYEPGFVRRVAAFTIPAGFVAFLATMVVYADARWQTGVTLAEERTAATIVLLIVGLWVLVLLARPFTIWRMLLVLAMVGLFILAMVWPFARDYFELELPPREVMITTFVVGGIAIVLLEVGWHLRKQTAALVQRLQSRFKASRAS